MVGLCTRCGGNKGRWSESAPWRSSRESLCILGARHRLASLLEVAEREGAVRIRRRDGRSYLLQPEVSGASPLDVEGVDLGVTTDEIVAMIREGRKCAG